MQKKILVLEDDVFCYNNFEKKLEGRAKGKIELTHATKIYHAEKLFFGKNRKMDVDLVIIDACNTSGITEPDTIPLVKEIRKIYPKLQLLATSSYELLWQQIVGKKLCQYGCDKKNLANKVCEILDI